ncbi:MAG: DUF1302 family protein [Deltaproteobacteria bacterium]|nr:DUF1302 family protein [Deltaproteobacteria bacterium]
MQIRTICKKLFILLGLVGTLITTAHSTWASTRIGNAEMQMWYRMRHTFHTDGGNNVNWVQWRNEAFFWFTYDDFVKNGKILNQDSLAIPFVKGATLNARYRFRADPTWAIRESYRNQYDRHERKSYLFPENGFRDLFLDLDFGQVGVGKLTARIGKQQIVWGESDLYRSIDVINPLRIDQNQGAGEKFDEFRTPLWALKLNYSIGNVGSMFSNVFIEPFYTPGFRGPSSDLIMDGLAFRAPVHIKGCLNDDNKLVDYRAENCSFRRADGSRVFVPWNPTWRGRQQSRHPWAFISRGTNPRSGSPDFDSSSDSPDIANSRVTYLPQVYRGSCKGPLNGLWNFCTTAMGFRIFGTSVGGFDFSLNYANIPQGVQGTFNFSDVFGAKVYGDADTSQKLGLGTPTGSFEEGLRRCLDAKGRGNTPRNHKSQNSGSVATILVGADLAGYNHPGRFRSNNKNGVLNNNGEPLPGKHNAVRLPRTDCFPANYHWTRTHVTGFTSTYNDFEYTGMVFRLEESFSSKEYVRKLPIGSGRNAKLTDPRTLDRLLKFSVNKDYHTFTPVWRSMVGFDLLKSVPSFKYIPFLHHSFSDQAWFFTGQWLMKNQWSNVANPLCYAVDNGGNGLTNADAKRLSRADGKRHYANAQCRNYRWNHLLTLAAVNQGLFASRVETRNAVVYEPRAKDWLLFSQWWWRNVLGMEAVELSAGVSWYPGSSMSQGWTGLYGFADRDQLWLEFTYYLL